MATFADLPVNYDPIHLYGAPNGVAEQPMAFAVYDSLFLIKQSDMTLEPELGLSFTSPNGGKKWTLKLRPNVKFSDGTSFDAAAVMFNWQRLADPANNANDASIADEIQTMAVVNPLTLNITLKTADPLWNIEASSKSLSYIASPTAINTEGANFGMHPVGAGPFILRHCSQTIASSVAE